MCPGRSSCAGIGLQRWLQNPVPDSQEDEVVDDESESRQPLGVQIPRGEVEGEDEKRRDVARQGCRRRKQVSPTSRRSDPQRRSRR